MPTTEQTVAALYDAWRNGQLDIVLERLADDIEHTIHIPPAMNPIGGSVHGRAATAERLAAIGRDYEILAFDNDEIRADGDEAETRVRLRYRHRQTGEEIETVSTHHWRLDENGRVALFEEFHDLPSVEAFSRRCGFCA
jgi:ketosteroid isomerase-like protein